MTNSLSNASFAYSGSTTVTDATTVDDKKLKEQQDQQAKEKKEKAEALVEKELSTTPIKFGMVANPIQTGKTASVSAALPIGQSKTQTIDKFSVDQICADIDGYEEVQDEGGIKSLISNFMSRFTSVNSTETQQLPAYSDGGLLDLPTDMQLSQETIDVLKNTGAFEQMQNLSQAQTTDKSQAEQLADKTPSFSRMQEIQQKMNDPNVSAEEKAKLMTEVQNLFAGTPKTQSTLPAGVVNTSSKQTANLTDTQVKELENLAAGGFDKAAVEAADSEVQSVVYALYNDAIKNDKNGIKSVDYC